MADSSERLEGRDLFEHPIADAVMETLRERGYRQATVGEFLSRAGVDRGWFDRQFESREEAILRVYEAFIADFTDRVQVAYDSASPWPASLRAAAYEVTRWMADHPDATWFGNVGIADAQELGRLRREELFRWCAGLIDGGRAVAPDPAAIGEAAPLIAVGAVVEMSRRQQEGSGADDPVAAVPALMYAAVRPYLGEEAARAELEIPPPSDLASATHGGATARSAGPSLSRRRVLADDSREPSTHKLAPVGQEKGRAKPNKGLPRLPPGRHGLSREFVIQNQRDRIAAGMIQVVVELGYAGATVTHVVAAAGVSRRTFYNYYGDKEKAFFDVYRQVTDFLCEAMSEAGESAKAGWAGRVRAELEALLECFSANPRLVRFCLVAPPEAGGEVAGAYRDFLERLLGILREGRPKRAKQPTPAAEYGLVGGLAALIVEAVEDDGAEGLERLLPEVLELVLAPYLGRAAAVKAAR